MQALTDNDLRFVLQRLPKDIRQLLTEHAGQLYLGGGFVRATIAGEVPSDIDLFGANKALVDSIATILSSRRPGSRLHRTDNAITLLTPERMPVQFITRWTFESAQALVDSFDFTVCQTAIWRSGNQPNSRWESARGDQFYTDLAGRRLVYTSPVREEEAGGSLLRVIKYVKRGYTIQVSSLGNVVARLAWKVRESKLAQTEEGFGTVLGGLLREVDPLLVIDGFDVVEDHEPAPTAEGEQ